MTILGYNTKGSVQPSSLGGVAGRMYVNKFTLASPGILTELHGWFNTDGAGFTLRLVIYAADGSSANPGTRLGYTSLLTLPLGDSEAAQTGLSVALAAGDYWIGWLGVGTPLVNVGSWGETTGGTYVGRISGAPDPPPNPFGTIEASGSRKHSVWGVVAPAAVTPVADFTGTPLSGTSPLNVVFTDASTNTPTSWAWTFGDGGTSTSQNPSHSYAAAGTYTVTLTATNAGGSNTKTRTAYVTVNPPAPVADFVGVAV